MEKTMKNNISGRQSLFKCLGIFVCSLMLIPVLLSPQPVNAQERQLDLALRLVPNRTGLIEVEPGKDNLLFLEVNNIGLQAITEIKLSSDKNVGWGFKFNPGVINSISPGSLQTVNVNVFVPGNVAGGEQSINIIAEARELRKVENFTLTVRRAVLSMRLLSPNRVPFPDEVRAGQKNDFLLEINNIGNKVVTDVRFSSDKAEGWVIDFNPLQIESLPPAALRTVNVTISPPSKATKEATQIVIIAEANETRQIESVIVTVKPAQIWIWVWIIAGVVVIIGFGLVYMRFGRQ